MLSFDDPEEWAAAGEVAMAGWMGILAKARRDLPMRTYPSISKELYHPLSEYQQTSHRQIPPAHTRKWVAHGANKPSY